MIGSRLSELAAQALNGSDNRQPTTDNQLSR
jgi:hypothetical protein